MKYRKYIIQLILPFTFLAIGGFIYIFFRENNVILNYYLRRGVILNLQNSLFTNIIYNNIILNFLINSVPGGLWSFFLLRLIGIIWQNQLNFNYYAFIFLSLSLIFIPEYMQYFGFLPGFFDSKDIISYSLFSIFALFLNSKEVKDEK